MNEYAVFRVEAEKGMAIAKVTSDDAVSRQTIVVRESQALGFEPGWKYVLIEGSPDAVKRARELFGEHGVSEAPNQEEVYKKIKSEEESATEGMGFIFG